MILDTCSDIALRAKLYEAKTGKPGLSKDDVIWFRHIHHASIFRLGPLQFQRFEMVYLDEEGCGQAYMTFASEQKAHLPQGTPVINLHIPKDANLSPATVADALDQAMAFFPQVFPEHRAKAFLDATLGCCIPDFRRFCRRKVTFCSLPPGFRSLDRPGTRPSPYGGSTESVFPKKRTILKIRSSSVKPWAGSPFLGKPAESWRSPPHRHPRWPNHHKLSTAASFPKGVWAYW